MDSVSIISIVVVALLAIILFWKIIKGSLKLGFKILLNTVVGFAALIVINFLGGFLGISIGINWTNALVVGVLGLPGVALLLILQWLFAI